MSAIEADGVWKYFGDFPALKQITWSAEPGACIALLVRTGAGKTTFLPVLAGLSDASRGTVRILGDDVRQMRTRRRIGWLGHGIGVYDDLSALENLLLFGRLYQVDDPTRTAQHWLERTGLAPVAESAVREFSRGMRQRLAVARAFLHGPDILLLDEPFTSLDDRAIALLQSVIREALDRGATAIMSTHQIREAMELASEVCLLTRGAVTHAGPRSQEMLQDPTYVYRTFGEPACASCGWPGSSARKI